MILRDVKLTNFRNLGGQFHIINGINILIAPNGTGKTNFLEAINYFSEGKSFRTNLELSTINQGLVYLDTVAFSHIKGVLEDSLGNENILEIVFERLHREQGPFCKKTLKLNTNKTILSKFSGHIASILFSPNTIDLVAGSPSLRRRDIDDFLVIYDHANYSLVKSYAKVLRGRNKLLEKLQQGFGNKSELSYWNQQLVELGSELIYKRVQIIDSVNPLIKEVAAELFNGDNTDLEIMYFSKFMEDGSKESIKDSFYAKIEEGLFKEITAGISLYGPQRDDFSFILDNMDLREFGSRGQQRLGAFLYKIGQRLLISKKTEKTPILLLDDLFSELDPDVCKRIQSYLLDLSGQLILTGLREDDYTKNFLGKGQLLKL